jgi:TonB family protein
MNHSTISARRVACLLVPIGLAAQVLAAQERIAAPVWHPVLRGDDGTTVAIDSANSRATGPTSFVVRTAVRFAAPMQLDGGRAADREIDVEEMDCGAGTSAGVVAGLYADTVLVQAEALPQAWAPVAEARKPVFEASCAFLLGPFSGGIAQQYELSAVEEQPELSNRDAVARALSHEFPEDMRQMGASGAVTVRFRVLANGAMDPGTIDVTASTHPGFNMAARRVAAVMRFRPARVNGIAVPVWLTIPITFTIETLSQPALPSAPAGEPRVPPRP